MKNLILLFSIIFLAQSLSFCNIAQPGMWQAGGMGNYALMFSEDSSAFQKIQMVDEHISILLYKGFAVVKGEYWMLNDTDETLTIKTGYPINGAFNGSDAILTQTVFDELHGLKVLVNGEKKPLVKEQKMDNWYVWNNTFLKNTSTKIEVYFLMNTNQAKVLQGYSSDDSNGFIYLLETGSVWKQPIKKGEIRLQAKNELTLENIRGIHPPDFFNKNDKEYILMGKFENLSPTEKNNIVISYGERVKNFDFQQILDQRDLYFAEADELGKMNLIDSGFEAAIFPSPFHVGSFKQNKIGIPEPTGLIGWIQIVFWGIIFLFAFLIALFIYKRFRK